MSIALRLTVLKVPKKHISNLNSNVFFPEIMLKIIHRPFCEQFQLELSYFRITTQKEACNHYYCGVNGNIRNIFVFRWTVPFNTMIHFCCFPRLLYICFVNRIPRQYMCFNRSFTNPVCCVITKHVLQKWNWETAVVLSNRNCYIVWLDEFMQVEILKRD